jgi:uncharacterized protein (DUF1684 family)
MTEQITLTLPEDISARVRQIAETTSQPVEQIVLDHLKSLSIQLPPLPPEDQAELDALRHLSDDALWTIAREQVPEEAQARAHTLMDKNSLGTITDAEAAELEKLVQRADRVMLRKAEAATILKKRGFAFSQKDFRPQDE